MKLKIRIVFSFLCILNSGMYFSQLTVIGKTDSLLSSYYRSNAPGMAVGIIKDGKVIYKKTFGLANLEYKIPITDSTAFNIASVSKQFTAFIALLAEKEGKLSLDDDIRTYLPELGHLPYKITIRQLANHTHGLPNFSEISKLRGLGTEYPVTNAEAIRTILRIRQISFKPGKQYQYNNTGFMLLAEILKRVYKKDFDKIANEYIFKPLNMDHSRVVNNPVLIIPNKADAYKQKGADFFKLPVGQMENGSSNIYTTLNDLCKWAVNFQKPSIGSYEIYDKMQKSTILSSGKTIEYGLGLQTEKYKGLDVAFHGGGTAGYRAYILHVPSQQFSVVTLGNQQAFDGLLIAYQLVDLFLRDKQALPPKPRKTTYSSSELKAFEGVYEISPGNYFEISTDGKALYMSTYNQNDKEALSIIGDNKFAVPFIPTASFTFHTGSADFRIADFTYLCKKVTLNPPRKDEMDLKRFVGLYRNDEFNIVYQLLIENGNLVAKHPVNNDILLYPLSKTSLYSTETYFGKIDFMFGANNKVSGFKLSGASFTNIEFKKIE